MQIKILVCTVKTNRRVQMLVWKGESVSLVKQLRDFNVFSKPERVWVS